MTKTRKNVLLTVILAVLFAAFSCLLVACVEPEQPTSYTVTVKAGTEPAKDVQVKFLKGKSTVGTKNTDANGKAEIELAADEYTVELDNLPQYYKLPQNANLTLTAENPNLTVTLEKVFTYTVKLVKADGTTPYFAQGVSVGICDDNGCKTPVAINSNGVAIIAAPAGDYHVKVFDLPVNASIPVDDDDYYTGESFTATKNEMTIAVTEYDILSINTLTPMTDKNKEDLEAEGAYYYKTENVSYHVSKQLAKGEIAYFSLTAEITGEYAISKDWSLTILGNGTEFVADEAGQGIYTTLSCEKGKTYYFKVVNHDEENAMDVDFVIQVPFSSNIDHSGQGGILDVTVGKENTNARISFHPSEAGEYKVTVTGAPAIVSINAYDAGETVDPAPEAEAYKENASETYLVYTSKVNGIVYIAITAKSDKYPVDLHVTIEKTKDVVDNTTVKKVETTLTKFDDAEEGKELVGVPMNDPDLTLTEENGVFFYNGNMVVVNILGILDEDRLATGGKLAYLELYTNNAASFKSIEQNDDGETVIDWSVFLRGFDKYTVVGGNMSIPENVEEKCYANYVNADGVYPLTTELKTFLEEFYTINETIIWTNVPVDTEFGFEWMFPLYYYDDAVEADEIVGDYKLVSFTDTEKEPNETFKVGDDYEGYAMALQGGTVEGKLVAETCIVRVKKNGTWQILTYDAEMEDYFAVAYDWGSWTKSDDGVYTFTSENGSELTFVNGTFTLVDDFYHATIVFGEAAEESTPPQQ